MSKYAVFENVIYKKNLSWRLYKYLRKKQPGLWKYFPIQLFYLFLAFLGIINKSKYIKLSLAFLGSVENLPEKITLFAKYESKKLNVNKKYYNVQVISEYPESIVRALCSGFTDGKIYAQSAYSFNNDMAKSAKNIKFSGEAADFADDMNDTCEEIGKTDAESTEHASSNNMSWLTLKEISCLIPDLKDSELYDRPYSVIRKKCAHFYTSAYGFVFKRRASFYISCILIWLSRLALIFGFTFVLSKISLYYAGISYDFTTKLIDTYETVQGLIFLNTLPIFIIFLLSYLLTNRAYAAVFITGVLTLVPTWINHYKLALRNDPFIIEDIQNIFEGGNMMKNYTIEFSKKIFVIAAALILLTIILYFIPQLRFYTPPRIRIGVFLLIFTASAFLLSNVYFNEKVYASMENKTAIEEKFINQWSTTHQFTSRGFIYPFIYSYTYAFDLTKPDGYSAADSAEILGEYQNTNIPDDKKVNVIGIMLEAYADFEKFDTLDIDTSVYKFLRDIRKEALYGELVTDIFAGNTITTERAFLTGFSDLPNFRKDTNSYVRYLKSQGYYCEGSHPCFNWFYNRKNVNSHIGFDNYYFSEDTYKAMSGYDTSPDRILMPNIIKLFEEREDKSSPYFSFNVSYQGHGPYSTEQPYYENTYCTSDTAEESTIFMLNNYLDSIKSTNDALDEFINYFRSCDDPFIIVFFGDHMPWMGNNNSGYSDLELNLDVGTEEGFYNYYTTPYVIWANDSAKDRLGSVPSGKGPTISPMYLMNVLFDFAGWGENQYMHLTGELMEKLPVINKTGLFVENGNLTSTLSDEAYELYQKFKSVQYYTKYSQAVQ